MVGNVAGELEVYLPSGPATGDNEQVREVYVPTGPLEKIGDVDLPELVRLRSHNPMTADDEMEVESNAMPTKPALLPTRSISRGDTHEDSTKTTQPPTSPKRKLPTSKHHSISTHTPLPPPPPNGNSLSQPSLTDRKEKIRKAIRRRNAEKLENAKRQMGTGFEWVLGGEFVEWKRMHLLGVKGVERIEKWAEGCARVGCGGWPELEERMEEGVKVREREGDA